MQDLLWLGGKRVIRRRIVPPRAACVLKHLKYLVLAFVAAGTWGFGWFGDTLWSPRKVFGMYASPRKGVPARAAFFSLGGVLLLAAMIGSFFIGKFFCKYLCPLSADALDIDFTNPNSSMSGGHRR